MDVIMANDSMPAPDPMQPTQIDYSNDEQEPIPPVSFILMWKSEKFVKWQIYHNCKIVLQYNVIIHVWNKTQLFWDDL